MSRQPRTVVSDEPVRLPLQHGLVALLYMRVPAPEKEPDPAPVPPDDQLPLEPPFGSWEKPEPGSALERALQHLTPRQRAVIGLPPAGGAA